MLNQIVISGRLCADPELRRTATDTAVCSFRIANQRDYKRQGEEKPATDFFDVSAWRGTAEFVARNFTKGRIITIVGRMETKEWTDTETGKKRTSYEIQADNAYFGDSKPADSENTGSYPTGGAPASGYPVGGFPAASGFSGAPGAAYNGYSYPSFNAGSVPEDFVP